MTLGLASEPALRAVSHVFIHSPGFGPFTVCVDAHTAWAVLVRFSSVPKTFPIRGERAQQLLVRRRLRTLE
jgi:hypothetical protein